MWAEDPGDVMDADGGAETARGSAHGVAALAAWLGTLLEEERTRWILWLPVAIGVGIGLYFALPEEPAAWLGPALASAALASWFRLRAVPLTGVLAAGLAAGTLGFAAAQLRVASVAAPVLEREMRWAEVEGRVVDIDRTGSGHRLTLSSVRISRLRATETPERVRITVRGRGPPPAPGTMIAGLASLFPPPAPAAPGAYDVQFRSYFEQLGAVGFARGPPRVIAEDGESGAGWRERLAVAGEGLRRAIAARITAAAPEPEAAVMTALMTGERGGIPEAVEEDFRRSGLAHLLAISGLHLTLVAGLVFFLIRFLLAAVEPVAVRYPIKKWAALAGLAAAIGYMVLVGAPVPTLRSVLMTGLVMTAIVLDRNPFSMRLVAVAAALILLTRPEAMLGPSFQMSFGAVVALIALAETVHGRWHLAGQGVSLVLRVPLYVAGLALSSAVATAATTPFALYHFQQASVVGVLANMVAVPMTAWWIMPLAVLSYALMPLGLDGPVLTVMGWGTSVLLGIAETVAEWPGSRFSVLPMPVWGIVAIALGGLWLALWQQRWRWFGLVPVTVGFASLLAVIPPTVLVDPERGLMAVRTEGGGLALSSGRAGFTGEVWLRRYGLGHPSARFPGTGFSADGRLSCDPLGCLYRVDGRVVALVRDLEALEEDCATADLVISLVPSYRCAAPEVLDFWDLRRAGATVVTLSGGDVLIETVADSRGARPWVSSVR